MYPLSTGAGLASTHYKYLLMNEEMVEGEARNERHNSNSYILLMIEFFFLDYQRSLELAIKMILCSIHIMYAFASLSQTGLLGWLKHRIDKAKVVSVIFVRTSLLSFISVT